MLKRAATVLGKQGLAALWLKEHGAAEQSMAQALKGYFVDLERQVAEKVNEEVERRIDEASQAAEEEAQDEAEEAGGMSEEEILDLAEEIADDLIDVDEIYQQVLEIVRPQIYDQVATGAANEWRLAVPAPERALDLLWVKSPMVTKEGIGAGGPIQLPGPIADAVNQYAEDILSRPYWRDVAETIRDDIVFDIKLGIEDGLSGKEVAAKLKDTLGPAGSEARANLIARTEGTGGLNAGHQATREQLADEGLIKGKTWLAILDLSTRETHVDANEQTVPVDEPFDVGGEEGMYPGDPDLSAAERCNCRCAAISQFNDDIGEDEAEKWVLAFRKWGLKVSWAA